MKKAGKVIAIIVVIAVVIIGSLLTYVKVALPATGELSTIKIASTPQRIERGKYLANHVTVCVDCHSKRDWTLLAGPIKAETLGAGGERFDQHVGLPGVYYSPNITPFALKNWSDGEILRAVTEGISKDGRALFPIMGYLHYGQMDKEDIYSIIAYIKTLPEQKSTSPAPESDFPMNFIINTIPKKASFQKLPAENDQIAYGKYLVNAASCVECHTQMNQGAPIEGMEFAGGATFDLPDATIKSANITPDEITGIGSWSEEVFVAKFKSFTDSAGLTKKIGKGDFQTVMPWKQYSNMKEKDLKAIFVYLKTLKPVKNAVVKFESKHNYNL
jgi:mono/diheme cytochrome c family protein